MGNCSNQYAKAKKSASESLKQIFEQRDVKSPLTFIIKQWPNFKRIDFTSSKGTVERTLDLSLYPGEKMQINLKDHQKAQSLLSQRHSVKSKDRLHCQIKRNTQIYQIDFPIQAQKQQLWRFTKGWTELNQGDIIKIGITNYKLCKIISQEGQSFINVHSNISNQFSNQSISAAKCRICLSTIETVQNPLISPCQCLGSVKFTHLRCLSKWIFSSSLNDKEFLSIRSNKTVCQLCKTDITNTEQFKRMQNIFLTNAHNIPIPYGIFQSFHSKKQQNVKDYFVLCFRVKKQYKFGRSQRADIMDKNDPHISKINSQLRYSNNRLMIKDCGSMHGTLMQALHPLKLSPANTEQILQFRNMLIKIIFQPKVKQSHHLQVLSPKMNDSSMNI